MTPMAPCATRASGATSSHSFMDPHSSASKWPKVIQRRSSTGRTRATASDTSGNRPRRPVWKSSGSSASIRNWLKLMPTSGTNVDRR